MRPTRLLPRRRPTAQASGIPRAAAAVTALGIALALALQGAVTSSSVATDGGSVPAATDPGTVAPVQNEPTSLRVSSFNVLGAGHTSTSGNKSGRGWASGPTRMRWAYQLIQRYGLDVVGLQEFEKPQRAEFATLSAGQFGVYPDETQLGDMARRDAIIWRTSEWELVEAHSIPIPYFYGNDVRMPYVLLRNVDTGREAWFFNTHNPADARGAAGTWRRQGYEREWNLVDTLRAEYPDVPVIVTGDKNATSPYFCPTARHSILHAANGSSLVDGTCRLSRPVRIDWVMGTPDVRYGGYRDIYSPAVRRVSDHHLVFADAQLPSVAQEATPVQHVVVVSVNGLRPWSLAKTGEAGTPVLHRMVQDGASTPNARTDFSTVDRRANVIGMLTGLRAHRHGVLPGHSYATVSAAAGRYVPSVFDSVHDLGMTTAVFTDDPETQLVDDSWDGTNGATDALAPWDGRGKLSHFVLVRRDRSVTNQAVSELRNVKPAVTFVQLSDPATAGDRYGFFNRHYLDAVRATDAHLGAIVRAVDHTSGLAGHTVVIVTSERGGGGARTHLARRSGYYRVPMYVTGPDVPAGANLYSLNPQLASPGGSRPTFSSRVEQPIRIAYVANLVTKLLGLPALPGSDQDPGQAFSVTEPTPAPTP